MNEIQRDTVTDEMVLAALNERYRHLGTPAPSLYHYPGSAVEAMRRSLKAALAAAPTTDEDPTVDYYAMWRKAEREREQAERERDDLRASMAELAPAEVCVRGDWFKVSELPEVLGRVMDARDEAQREAKRYHLRAMTPAPTTARDLLAMLPDLCYEPEGGEVPARAGYVVTRGGAVTNVTPLGLVRPVQAEPGEFRYLLLDPPAPVTPEWHSARIVEATCRGRVGQWARTATDDLWVSLDGTPREAYTPALSDVTVVVPGEVGA